MSFTYSDDMFSDFHKEAYGYRPSQDMWKYWDNSSPEWKQKIWNELENAIEHNFLEEARMQADALARFEGQISKLLNYGATNRKQAIRWFLESMDLTEFDLAYGAGYVCYRLGLNPIHASQFTEIIEDMIDSEKTLGWVK